MIQLKAKNGVSVSKKYNYLEIILWNSSSVQKGQFRRFMLICNIFKLEKFITFSEKGLLVFYLTTTLP